MATSAEFERTISSDVALGSHSVAFSAMICRAVLVKLGCGH